MSTKQKGLLDQQELKMYIKCQANLSLIFKAPIDILKGASAG